MSFRLSSRRTYYDEATRRWLSLYPYTKGRASKARQPNTQSDHDSWAGSDAGTAGLRHLARKSLCREDSQYQRVEVLELVSRHLIEAS